MCWQTLVLGVARSSQSVGWASASQKPVTKCLCWDQEDPSTADYPLVLLHPRGPGITQGARPHPRDPSLTPGTPASPLAVQLKGPGLTPGTPASTQGPGPSSSRGLAKVRCGSGKPATHNSTPCDRHRQKRKA